MHNSFLLMPVIVLKDFSENCLRYSAPEKPKHTSGT